MSRIFTVWKSPPGLYQGDSFTLSEGEGVPRGASGAELEPGALAIHRFEATSFNDAMGQYYEFMGWGPYRPRIDNQGRPYPGDAAPFK